LNLIEQKSTTASHYLWPPTERKTSFFLGWQKWLESLPGA
jgi:hypothetical protein